MAVDIHVMTEEQLTATVDVWVRARWDAQPWLEERLGYTPEQNLAFFRDVVRVEYEVWTAIDDGSVIGLIAVADGEIDQLYVAPECQRQGVGSALLAKAKQLSPEWLGLYTHQRNERARQFYERKGFAAVKFGISAEPESEPDVRYEWRANVQHDAS